MFLASFFICTVLCRDASVAGGHGCWTTVCLVYGSRSTVCGGLKKGQGSKLSFPSRANR